MKKRNRTAVKNVMDALVLSGIAMLKFGNSRLASGAEHHISHYLEMKSLMVATRPQLQGISVGVATRDPDRHRNLPRGVFVEPR